MHASSRTFIRSLLTPKRGVSPVVTMRLVKILGFLQDVRLALSFALWPTIKAIYQSPSLCFSPQEVSRIFMSHVWSVYGDGVDGNSREEKEKLVRKRANGIVLDLGAGMSFA